MGWGGHCLSSARVSPRGAAPTRWGWAHGTPLQRAHLPLPTRAPHPIPHAPRCRAHYALPPPPLLSLPRCAFRALRAAPFLRAAPRHRAFAAFAPLPRTAAARTRCALLPPAAAHAFAPPLLPLRSRARLLQCIAACDRDNLLPTPCRANNNDTVYPTGTV